MNKFDIHNMEKREKMLFSSLSAHADFMVIGDATDFIKKWADSLGVEIHSTELQSIEDIRGERVIVTNVSTPYYYYKSWFSDVLDEVSAHIDKEHLILIYVDKADNRTINALKFYMENKNPENLFYGIICRDTKKKINSTINGLCFIHIWENDEDGNC